MDAILVRNADRMMTQADRQKEGIRLTFADGCKSLVPFSDLPEIKDPASLESVELPTPYEVVLRTVQGQAVEIPWDFVRSYCDASYRPRVEAVAERGRQSLGARLRTLREQAGLSQEKLASSAGLGRVTLSRIENGEQSPRFDTLEALSKALQQPLTSLMAGEANRD